jgi:hypothetical protein
MQTSTAILIGDKELRLRYENKQQQDIKHNAPKRFMPEVKGLHFSSPIDILSYLGDTDVQIYLLKKGLEWSDSGIEKITDDIAADLRQEHLEMGEPDEGEKIAAFLELLTDALCLNVMGASGKKLNAKGKEEQAKTKSARVEEWADVNEARILAQHRAQQKIDAEKESLGMSGTTPTSDSA